MSAPEKCIDCTLGVYGGDCNACETVEPEGPTFKTQRPGPECPWVLLAAKERECERLRGLCETLTISGCPRCGAEIGCNIDCVSCLQYHELVLARAALAEERHDTSAQTICTACVHDCDCGFQEAMNNAVYACASFAPADKPIVADSRAALSEGGAE